MAQRTLGLDIGTNSIGWALLEGPTADEPDRLVDAGVRIFLEAVDAKTRVPKNQARRQARGLRRLLARRRMRRDNLQSLLVNSGLLPADSESREKLLLDDTQFNPYLLRSRGLDEKLSPFEFGRVLFHLSRRRGFKSNRKAQLADLLKDAEVAALVEAEEVAESLAKRSKSSDSSSNDEGAYKAAVRQLGERIAETGYRTLGEFLFHQPKKRAIFIPERSMYENEFELLWNKQVEFHPELLTTELKAEVYQAIFFQRPLRTQKYLVGRCSFEPTRKRASKALLEYQEFRLLQDLTNLRIRNPISREERELTTGELEILTTLLTNQKSLTWGRARKALGFHDGEKFSAELSGKDELKGNRTHISLRNALPERWDGMDQENKRSLITDLLTIARKDSLYRRLKKHWKFSTKEAYDVATLELEPGYASLSLKAINKLLPKLREGLDYHDSCQAVGYERRDQIRGTAVDRLPLPPNVRNPVVQKALFETRKVMNAIIRVYGKPQVIRIELARDMKLTKRQKMAAEKIQKENTKANEEAREKINDLGITKIDRDSLLKYRLWKEQSTVCPYSGTSISMAMLFGPEVDVDHIIPYSRSLDDSYMNKVVCLSSENRTRKGNRTPYEAYSGNAELYSETLLRISPERMPNMPWGKRNRFEVKEVDTDKFVNRQLSDTRYICLEVKSYLDKLGVEVQVSKGEATSAIRHRLGLNRILNSLGHNDKDRADHRHHAIDAIVIALTSRGLFMKLSRLSAQTETSLKERGFKLPLPWLTFFEDVSSRINSVIVSHSPNRKVRGALHEDTAYGFKSSLGCFVYRKTLNKEFKITDVDLILDEKVKALVRARLEAHDNNAKFAFERPVMHTDGLTPIKKVRIRAHKVAKESVFGVRDQTLNDYKFFKFGSNHRVEIFEDELSGKRRGEFITMFQAAKQFKQAGEIEEPTVEPGGPGKWKFIMSLCLNDMVEIDEKEGARVFRVQQLSGAINRIQLQPHTVSKAEDQTGVQRKTVNQFRGRKINVDPIGRVYPCND